jgi:hypothetical protein
MEHGEERPVKSELIAALAEFHKTVGKIVKTAENPFFKKNYADLAAILDVVDGPMSSSGLAFIAWPEYRDGTLLMVGRIEHTDGEFREGVFPLFGNKPQDIGSSITYARRYLLQSLLNLAAEDDDGNGASGVDGKGKPPQQIQKTGPNNPSGSPARKPVKTNGKKLNDEVTGLKVEFGRIMITKDENGQFLFDEQEQAHGKELLVKLIADTPQVRKEKLEIMIADAKETLRDRVKEVFHGGKVPQNIFRMQPGQSSAQIPAMYDTSEKPQDTDSYEPLDEVETPPSPPPAGKKPVTKLGEIPGVHRGVAPAAVPPEEEATGEELDIF